MLSKHPFLNLLRCFILPVAYGIFLAIAQLFLNKPNSVCFQPSVDYHAVTHFYFVQYGLGSPVAISSLSDEFGSSLSLIWVDSTNGTGVPSANDIIARITRNFTSSQLNFVKKVATPDDIPSSYPQNFNLFSECFAAIAFNYLPTSHDDTSPIEYTIRADGGLDHIDVMRHTSDYEKRILPLQWAIDQVFLTRSCSAEYLTA